MKRVKSPNDRQPDIAPLNRRAVVKGFNKALDSYPVEVHEENRHERERSVHVPMDEEDEKRKYHHMKAAEHKFMAEYHRKKKYNQR